ncbi:MAG: hypothetical protein ACE15F_04780 [bacterium]
MPMDYAGLSLASFLKKQPGIHVLLLGWLIVGTAVGSNPETENPPGETRPNMEQQLLERRETQEDLDFWLRNMLLAHRYTWDEAARVTGMSLAETQAAARRAGIDPATGMYPFPVSQAAVLPYPGGRHPRIGFLEGAVDPIRATKASVFLPGDPQSYVVIDLPEAIFRGNDLIFLAHTHIPTVWEQQNRRPRFRDWRRHPDGSLTGEWPLPDGVIFGATIESAPAGVEMELWLRNGTNQTLTSLRTQVCVMLKGAAEFADQTNTNKLFEAPVAAARSNTGNRWILTAWSPCGRVWGNEQVPCIHADPVFPDCHPDETVRARGRLWFYEENGIQKEMNRAKAEFAMPGEP